MVVSPSVLYRQFGKYFGKYLTDLSIEQFQGGVTCKCEHNQHKITEMPENFPRTYFVYDEKFRLLGSVLLRTFQTANLLKCAFGKNITTISTQQLETIKIEDAVLVFSKTAIRSTCEDLLHKLQNDRNILIADPIDSGIDSISKNFHSIITTEQNFDFSGHNYPVTLHYLPHAPDWRLQGTVVASNNSKCLYLGSSAKDIFGKNAEIGVKRIYTKDFSVRINSLPRWSKELSKFNYHLTASMPAQVSVTRPTTKLITALMLGAIPIIGRWEKGSIQIVGPEYPYVLSTFEPETASAELNSLLKQKLLTFDHFNNLRRKSERFYCPANHANEWMNLFSTLIKLTK